MSVAPTAGNDLAVALGANRPSAVGSPRVTLLAVRPLLEEQMQVWSSQALGFRWSELHDTNTSYVTNVVSNIICNYCGISRIIFWYTCLDFPD